MRAALRSLWESRSPRERTVLAVCGALAGIALYLWLLQSADRARLRLGPEVASLRAQADRVDRNAAEIERLRAAPAVAASGADLRTLVQAQAGAAGLGRALARIDAADENQVQVAFGAVAFSEWLAWAASLRAQLVRVEACKIESLSTPGMVGVSATLVRAKPR